MVKLYKNFNLICAVLSAFFLLGTIWIWRGEWAEVRREKKMNEIAEVKDMKTEDLRLKIIDEEEKKLSNLEIEKLSVDVTTTVATQTIKIVKTLPKQINLNVPFTSQAPEKDWGQPWQDACEEAAILMMDAYYKKYNLSPLFAKDELLRVWDWEQTKNFGKSIEIQEIQEIFSKYFNFKSNVVENPTVDDIKKSVAGGNPVLVVADGKVLPNPHFRNGGPVYHALIIRGYDEDEFITNDPGTQFGKNFKYKYDDLMNAIHDWNNGNVSEGKKVILVIE